MANSSQNKAIHAADGKQSTADGYMVKMSKVTGPKKDKNGKKIKKAPGGKYGSYIKERKEMI